MARALSPQGLEPSTEPAAAGQRPLHRPLPTHLQERVELLLFLPVHISFLKELEIRDEAPTRSHVPGGMFTCGSQGGRWAHSSETRGRDRAGQGVWESGLYSIVGSGSQ